MSAAYDSALTRVEPYLLLPLISFKPSRALTEAIREANENLPRLRSESRIAATKLGVTG